MNAICRALVVGALAATSPLVAPTGSAAHEKDAPPLPLTCENGQSYDVVVVPGHGHFTPAHDVHSSAVFIPVSFGTFTGTLYDDNGVIVKEEIHEGDTKGSGKQRNTTSCTYSFTDAFTVTEAEAGDPAHEDYLPPGDYLFEGSGSVIGQIRGRG